MLVCTHMAAAGQPDGTELCCFDGDEHRLPNRITRPRQAARTAGAVQAAGDRGGGASRRPPRQHPFCHR
jgi:hypothetical protein